MLVNDTAGVEISSFSKRIFYEGCRSNWVCPKCSVNHVCDSSGKAGTKEGNILYILGPCACGKRKCDVCDYDGTLLFSRIVGLQEKEIL